MGCCCSGGHIAGDHIHTDMTICDFEELQKKYHFRTDSYRLLREGCSNMFTGSKSK